MGLKFGFEHQIFYKKGIEDIAFHMQGFLFYLYNAVFFAKLVEFCIIKSAAIPVKTNY